MKAKEYNYTLGILSCIGIVCVVMGHMGCNLLTIDNWIYYYSFHMPLFVFISGYFFNSRDTENVRGYIWKKIKKLLIPFYTTALIYTFIHTVLATYDFSLGLKFSLYNWLVYPWVNDQSPGFNVACWFMIALFLVNVIHIIAKRFVEFFLREKTLDIIILLIYITITVGIIKYRENYKVKGVELVLLRSLFLMMFYQLGFCYRKYFEEKDNLPNLYYFGICLGIRFLITLKYGPSDYAVYNISFGTPAYVVVLAALTGIAFWLRIAKILTPLLSQSRLLIYIGQHTMEIMMHHLFAVFIIQLLFYYFSSRLGYFSGFDAAAFKSNVYYKYIPIEQMRLFYTVSSIGIVLSGVYLKEKILAKTKKSIWDEKTMEKNCKVELLRFLAALMIMDGHIGVLFGENPLRPFSGTWFYVEFFFMLTAYFTAKHFDDKKYYNLEFDRKAAEGIKYTLRKFTRFMPYTTIPILLMYLVTNSHILQEQGKIAFLCSLEDMPFEMLYMSAGNVNGTRLFPLWFISAMFIVFPLFCFLCQIKNRRLICLTSTYCVLFYYFSKYDYGSHVYPNQLIRAMSGLLLGYIVYETSMYLKNKRIKKQEQWIITNIEWLSFLLPIFFSIWNIRLLRIYLVCFSLFLVTTFSGHSLIPNFRNKILVYLGRISMPMYIWHYLIGTILNKYLDVSLGTKIWLFYGITMLVSAVNMVIVDGFSAEIKL